MNRTISTIPTNDLKCTVVSIVPFAIKEAKPGLIPPTYEIAASEKGEPQILHIGTAVHYVYIDADRGSLQVRDSPQEVARSIVEDYVSSQLEVGDGVFPGIFYVPGEFSVEEIKSKFEEELAQLKIAQYKWLLQLTRLADKDWSQYQKPNVISAFQRKAAEIIGLKVEQHPWMNPEIKEIAPVIELSSCPGCGSGVRDGIAVCPSCKCVLDAEKYKTLAFAS